METLASCYFCGAALDKRLQEYPVVPEAFRDGDDVTTATLCPACHQKLATIFEAVVAAADAPVSTATGDGLDTDSQTTGTVTEASDPDPDTATPSADAAEADSPTEEADEAIEDDGMASGTDTPESAVEDVDALAGDIDADILDETDDGGSDEDDELRSAMEADVPMEFQSVDDGATESGDDPSEADADPTGDASGEDDGDDAGEPATARTSISALEYNKVMRLLQNRNFPVGRGEIETVAANAYDLSPAECAEVIDLAVDRGLIDEDGDQLVRPD